VRRSSIHGRAPRRPVDQSSANSIHGRASAPMNTCAAHRASPTWTSARCTRGRASVPTQTRTAASAARRVPVKRDAASVAHRVVRTSPVRVVQECTIWASASSTAGRANVVRPTSKCPRWTSVNSIRGRASVRRRQWRRTNASSTRGPAEHIRDCASPQTKSHVVITLCSSVIHRILVIISPPN